MGRWAHPSIRTGPRHRSSLWLSARQSTPRPGKEYSAVPAQMRRLRTNPTLTGPVAITLHRLQRTPDQTITLSGSQTAQTAPKVSDSTDKRGPGAAQPLRGEREISRVTREHWILKNFPPSVPLYIERAASAAALLPDTGGHVELSGSEELKDEVEMCSLLSSLQSV